MYPGAQRHWYAPTLLTHVAPFWHGFTEHSSTSEKINHKYYMYCSISLIPAKITIIQSLILNGYITLLAVSAGKSLNAVTSITSVQIYTCSTISAWTVDAFVNVWSGKNNRKITETQVGLNRTSYTIPNQNPHSTIHWAVHSSLTAFFFSFLCRLRYSDASLVPDSLTLPSWTYDVFLCDSFLSLQISKRSVVKQR